jgi:hypothetical protein
MKLLLRIAIVTLLCTFGAIPYTFAAGVDVFVVSGVTHDILRFDGVTGTPLGIFAYSRGTMDMAFGPNGDLFVISGPNESILRFDGNTGRCWERLPLWGDPRAWHSDQAVIYS